MISPKGHITPFGVFEEETLVTNTLELDKLIKVSFSTVGEYKANVHCGDSLFNLSLVDGVISNGKAIFKIEAQKTKQEIADLLNGREVYYFSAKVQAQGVEILNSALTVCVANKPERVLTIIDEEEIDFGKASYYPSFFFWKEKGQDTLRYNLNECFNQPAIECASSVRFKIANTDDSNDFQVLINETPCTNNEFAFDGKATNSTLSIVFNKDAKQGKRYFQINPIQAKETDRINRTPINQYHLSARAIYSVNYNPLAIMLYWLFMVLLILLIIWFMIIKSIMYPRTKIGRIIITDPYYKSLKIHGARKVVFTNQIQRQSLLNRIFTGRIVYEVDRVWTSPIELEPVKKALRLTTKGKYLVTPFATRLEKNTEYEVQNIDTKQKITITIN